MCPKKIDNKRYKIKINEESTSSANDAINQKIKEENLWTSDYNKFYEEEKGDSYVTSTCTGNKKALFIGINYFKSKAELNGCINDVKNVSELVCQRFGFKNCLYLTDENPNSIMRPTYKNIVNGMKWLVRGAKSGDSLFFHYSGHGGTSTDSESDEIDGFDETILPVDYEYSGQMTDDVIYRHLVEPLPEGCRLTAIFDSCHSGTVMDLPYTYQCDGQIEVISNSTRKSIFSQAFNLVNDVVSGNNSNVITSILGMISTSATATDSNVTNEQVVEKRKHLAEVIQFSGCKDDQTSADAKINNQSTGAMSYAFITAMNKNSEYSYADLLKEIRSIMKTKGFTQIPQLSTSHPMNMNSKFIM
ncbi:peptidase C14 [Piromyces finnis]|uniref:Peptidase C14 n=1 Tax=Piromyces finnis TaxID=1754191 RepID=A0A1Y1V4L0_9FUNG|nr:peptidase C14 [Piromyces finnis]|eukprot:ORX46394.1 peptidase C14 [Piromyces finnis]